MKDWIYVQTGKSGSSETSNSATQSASRQRDKEHASKNPFYQEILAMEKIIVSCTKHMLSEVVDFHAGASFLMLLSVRNKHFFSVGLTLSHIFKAIAVGQVRDNNCWDQNDNGRDGKKGVHQGSVMVAEMLELDQFYWSGRKRNAE